MSQLHINENVKDSFSITDPFNNVWNNCTVAEEDSGILAWLSPLGPQIRHHDIRTRRIDDVGDWLLQTEEYQNWFGGIGGGKSDSSALFCYGSQGVGKTYISSLVIDTLSKQAVEGNVGVACFYFDFAAQEGQSPAAVLGSVLKQIVGGLGEVPERIVKAFRRQRNIISGRKLMLSEIVEFLQDVISSRPTFICIDALDECRAEHRANLLNSLNQILQKSPGSRLFLTGRPHIWGEVEKHLAERAATRSITATKNDIITFLRAKIKEDTMPDAADESLEAEIIQDIPGMASEIFLLVFLSIETILQETTIYRRRQRLIAMKNGLDLVGAYGAMLGKIKAQGKEKARLGMAVLMWISHSRRPLQVDEIRYALATSIGSNDLDSDNIPAISTMLACCQGLVTVDKGDSTVRLIHYTLQEYLYTQPNIFNRAHSTMAETCLKYLHFQRVKDLPAGPYPDRQGAPFLEYSALYWGTHMRMELSDRAKIFALQLLGQFENHISAKSLWKSITERLPFYYRLGDKPFSALHCISYFGIADLTNALIKMNRWDVNQRDDAGMTPLIWAARYGHEEVVRLLLRNKHIQPDQHDMNDRRTALSWAAGNGHEGVVRLFLRPRFVDPGRISRRLGKVSRVLGLLVGRRYVNPDSLGKFNRTALSWAAISGHEGIVKLLLGRKEVNPDIPDTRYGQTPLSHAAENGHEGIVKLLLGQNNVKPGTRDMVYGRTPLWWAAEKGHEGIVKLLLGKCVNPNSSCESGRTPLSLAAENGYEGIVKLLLGGKYIYPNSACGSGRTPLAYAAGRGHEGIVKLLLWRKDANPNSSCESGRTPLSLAAENGHERIVKLLLGREGTNPNARGKWRGKTPLSLAAENGHEGIVKLLLGREDTNPNAPSGWRGKTPLSLAAEGGHEEIVELLLGRKDVNPDTPDAGDGRTPLSQATGGGHEGIVKLLLGRKDVNPNTSCDFGRTPLSFAVGNGHEGIVKLLLGREDISPNIPGKWHGETPVTLAVENGHVGILGLLLGRKDVDPDPPDTEHGQTPLLWAAWKGHEEIVKLLLERDNVNPNSSYKSGRTPLSWAAGKGHEGIVELLLEQEHVNPDSSCKSGRTPLSFAAGNGHEGVVRLLLGRKGINPDTPDTEYGQTPFFPATQNGYEGRAKPLPGQKYVNPDIPDKHGRTPLLWAARNGHEGIVRLLLERNDVNPNVLDTRYGQTPLSHAAENGHERIVKLLLVQNNVKPGTRDMVYGRTPLLWAAGRGHEGIVKLLLERNDVDPDTPDSKYCRTPLSYAAGGGHEGIVKLLIEQKDVNLNSSSNSGRTPLQLAAGNGHDRVVELLQARHSRCIQ